MRCSTDSTDSVTDVTDFHIDKDVKYQTANMINVQNFAQTDLSIKPHQVVGVVRTHGVIKVRIGTLNPCLADDETITS
jgi:hypothetical protein